MSVALSGNRYLIGANFSGKKCDGSGAAYIFCRLDGVFQGKAKLAPTDGASGDYFGYDVDISGYTYMIGPPNDDMVSDSGPVYVYTRRYNLTWEEVQELTPLRLFIGLGVVW